MIKIELPIFIIIKIEMSKEKKQKFHVKQKN